VENIRNIMSIHNLIFSFGYAESQSFAQVCAYYEPGAETKEEIVEKFLDTVKRYLISKQQKRACCEAQLKRKTPGSFCKSCGRGLGNKIEEGPDEEEIFYFAKKLRGFDIDSFSGEDENDFFEKEGWNFWCGTGLGHTVQITSWDYPTARKIEEYWIGPIPTIVEDETKEVYLKSTEDCKNWLGQNFPSENVKEWTRVSKSKNSTLTYRTFTHSIGNIIVTVITGTGTDKYLGHLKTKSKIED
jgi:hypothetical protein